MNLNKKITSIIGILIIILVAGIVIAQNSSRSTTYTPPTNSASHETTNPNATGATTSSVTSNPSLTPTVKTYTLAEVAKHSTQSSCWSTVNGGVYDLTAWIGQHPGGPDAILGMCGKDGSAAFNDQHGGQRRPANELAGFKIGNLSQ